MGWITRTPAGTWKASYRDPAKRIRSKSFRRKEDAKRFLSTTEADKLRGAYHDPSLGRTTLGEFWPRFLESSPHLRPATLELYGGLAKRYILPALESMPLAAVSRLDVERWVSATAGMTGAGTTNAAYRLLRRIMSAAEEAGIIVRNPARGVKTPRPNREEMRFLTADELWSVVHSTQKRYRSLVTLLGLCGLRVGETIALRVEDVDLLRRRVRVTKSLSEVRGRLHEGPTKTRSNRAVALPQTVAEAIAEHLSEFPAGPKDLLFTSSEGETIRRTNFRRRVWIPALRSAQIEEPLPRIHDLRHTAASLAIEAGAHPKAIQDMLGHSSITTTLDRYGHLFPALSDQVAAAVDASFRSARRPNASGE